MDDNMKNYRLLRNIVLILLILALNVAIYVGYRGRYSWEGIWNFVSGSTITVIIVIIGLYCLKTVVWIIPIYVLYIGAGFLLPVWPAITVYRRMRASLAAAADRVSTQGYSPNRQSTPGRPD